MVVYEHSENRDEKRKKLILNLKRNEKKNHFEKLLRNLLEIYFGELPQDCFNLRKYNIHHSKSFSEE